MEKIDLCQRGENGDLCVGVIVCICEGFARTTQYPLYMHDIVDRHLCV